jgi:hypothetical protein
MNKRKTTASVAIVGLALLATITMVSPTQALALGHWNLDEDFVPNSDFAGNPMDSSGTSDNTDEETEDSGDEEGEDSTTSATTDEDEEEGSEDSIDNSNGEDSSSSGYQAFQNCLAEIEESPTEEEVHDCVDSSYSGTANSEDTPIASSTDGGDEENGEHVSSDMKEHVSTDDTELDEEIEEEEELEEEAEEEEEDEE